MLGTIVNAGAIILGALLGNLLKGGFPERYKSVIMQGISLVVILIGLSMALETQNILVITLSIVTGGILGEALKIEERLNNFGKELEQRFAGSSDSDSVGSSHEGVGLEDSSPLNVSHVDNANSAKDEIFDNGASDGIKSSGSHGENRLDCGYEDAPANGNIDGIETDDKVGSRNGSLFIRGFVSGSLVFCVGAMAIMGALESGLTGNHTTLFIKSIIDGITATVFASTMGIGVAFSALAVFVYQGAITLAAVYVKPFLTEAIITEMTAVGGLLIFGIGLNLLTDKLQIKVGNLLPAIFAAIFFVIIVGKFSL
ncbi:MAG: DUF554 domain-containing protein [Syntrophaceticus sp.]|nr:DUF554 domain-containing protein [Syntrophaceticus sp.]